MFVEAIRSITGRPPVSATAPLVAEASVYIKENPFPKDLYQPKAPVRDRPTAAEPLQIQMLASPSVGNGLEIMVHFRSFPVRGRPTRYEWDFGDGERDYLGWSSTMHTYRARFQTSQPHMETFSARLRAWDDYGQEATATQVITLWVTGERNNNVI